MANVYERASVLVHPCPAPFIDRTRSVKEKMQPRTHLYMRRARGLRKGTFPLRRETYL